MMNFRWAQFMGVAVGVIAAGLASCAVAPSSDGQKLHVAAAPADFATLGIGEKNPRSGKMAGGHPNPPILSSGGIFDGLLEMEPLWSCGLAIIGFYGSHDRAVTVELTTPGNPTRRVMRNFKEPGSFATDRADIKIGPHQFNGDLDTYFIHVDPAETGGVGCDLALRRRVASYRPATGYIEAGNSSSPGSFPCRRCGHRHADADGVTRQVTGSGYHDHNWFLCKPRAKNTTTRKYRGFGCPPAIFPDREFFHRCLESRSPPALRPHGAFGRRRWRHGARGQACGYHPNRDAHELSPTEIHHH